MPLNLVGETPFGVIFAKSDGSQVTVPHDLAGPLLAAATPPAPGGQPGDVPDVPPVPAGAPAPVADQPPAPATPGMFHGLGGPPGAAPAPPPSAQPPAPIPAAPSPAAAPTATAPPRPAAPAPSASSDPAKLILQAGQDASNAQLAEGDAQARHLDETAPKLEAAYKSSIAANASAEIDFRRFMDGVDQQSKALGQQIADLSKQRINPNAWFQGQSGIGQFLTLVSIAAGGYGASATGGQNTGLSTVNRMIDQNIQAQLSNLQNQRDLAHDRMTLLQQDVARGMDVHSAVTKARAVALEQTAKLIELEGAKSGSDVVRANAANLAAKSREAAAKTFADFYSQKQQTAASYYATNSANMRERNQLAATSALDIMKAQLGYAEHIQANQAKGQESAAKQGALIVPAPAFSADASGQMKVSQGAPMLAFDDTSANKARDLAAHTAAAMKALQEYRQSIIENRGARGGAIATEGFQKMSQKRAEAWTALFHLKFQRAPTSIEDEKFLSEELPPPQGLLNFADPYQRLQGALGSIAESYNSQIGTYVRNPQQLAMPANLQAAPPSSPPDPGEPERHYMGRRETDGQPIYMPLEMDY